MVPVFGQRGVDFFENEQGNNATWGVHSTVSRSLYYFYKETITFSDLPLRISLTPMSIATISTVT